MTVLNPRQTRRLMLQEPSEGSQSTKIQDPTEPKPVSRREITAQDTRGENSHSKPMAKGMSMLGARGGEPSFDRPAVN